jgi:rhamnose utilization protein RhaD (predicted bifunctional aldolase and dehydrogenase)
VIKVEQTGEGDPLEFEVIVRVGAGETRHHITMARDACERLAMGTYTPEHCIRAAFQFLLDREPKESILRRFDITVISRYFPEFERELPRYLSQP